MLLRFGAYAIMDDDSGAAESFCEADIDTILGKSQVITYDLPKRGEDGEPVAAVADGAAKVCCRGVVRTDSRCCVFAR